MPRQTLRSMVDRLLDGRLVDYLSARKAAGFSNDDIAHELRRDLDISVTGEAIRKWCEADGIKKAEAVA